MDEEKLGICESIGLDFTIHDGMGAVFTLSSLLSSLVYPRIPLPPLLLFMWLLLLFLEVSLNLLTSFIMRITCLQQ